MTTLRDEEDRHITDEEEIFQQVHKYYEHLYTQPTVTFAESREQARALTLIDRFVPDDDNRRLEEVPGAKVLKEMVEDLPPDKSSREDGVPAEVLQEL
ncbi:hypothetical protein R1flu_008281 [Riccia fluitans]|uniref:Uncharacterized protein n=1 Tax=Riccia fluitans TaxID=41844 RepID=A0ABD1YB88_9MARC